MATSKSRLSQPKISPEEKQWRVNDAMNTLRRAEEIKKDRSLMRDVQKSASSLMGVVNRVSKVAPRGATKRK